MVERDRASTIGTKAELVLDMATRELRRGTLPVHVEPKVFDLIGLLVRNPGRVVETREITAELWPSENVCDGALRQCVWSARRALRDSARDSQFIRTVHRWGYRFVGCVAAESETLLRLYAASTETYDGLARAPTKLVGIEHVT
jgi:DNA-binding winged helix-turn-helix (wHTH) protein